MSSKFPTTSSLIEYLNGLDPMAEAIDNSIFTAFFLFFLNINNAKIANNEGKAKNITKNAMALYVCKILSKITNTFIFKKCMMCNYLNTIKLQDRAGEYFDRIFSLATINAKNDILSNFILDNNYITIHNSYIYWDTSTYNKIREKEDTQQVFFGYCELLESQPEIEKIKSFIKNHKNTIIYYFVFFEEHIIGKIGYKYDIEERDNYDYLSLNQIFVDTYEKILENVVEYIDYLIYENCENFSTNDMYELFIKDYPFNIQIIVLSNILKILCKNGKSDYLKILLLCGKKLIEKLVMDPLFNLVNMTSAADDNCDINESSELKKIINDSREVYELVFSGDFKLYNRMHLNKFMKSVATIDFEMFLTGIKNINKDPTTKLDNTEVINALCINMDNINVDNIKLILNCCEITSYENKSYISLIKETLKRNRQDLVKYLIDNSKHTYRIVNVDNKMICKQNTRENKLDILAPIEKTTSPIENCPICICKIANEHRKLPCDHTFCKSCIDEWVLDNKNNGCPLCRVEFM